jgi:hypothetical protein
MRLRFPAKFSAPDSFPKLWDTDVGWYVIQGFGLDADTLAQVGDVPLGELVSRVPKNSCATCRRSARCPSPTRRSWVSRLTAAARRRCDVAPATAASFTAAAAIVTDRVKQKTGITLHAELDLPGDLPAYTRLSTELARLPHYDRLATNSLMPGAVPAVPGYAASTDAGLILEYRDRGQVRPDDHGMVERGRGARSHVRSA